MSTSPSRILRENLEVPLFTVSRAFDELLRRNEPSEREREDAARQHITLRETLAQAFGPELKKSFLSGSYARRTAIKPLHDIDFFAVLADRRFVNQPADACMKPIAEALRRKFPDKVVTWQRRSLNIEFSGTGIGYDIVPAIEFSGDIYQIPDRKRDGWIKTNPKKHKETLDAANQVAGNKLNPLIKLGKLWNRHQGGLISSFHLEVTAYSAFRAPPESYPLGFAALLAHLARRLQSRTADPAGVGPDVDESLSDQDRRRAIAAASEAAQSAQFAAQSGDHAAFRRLFGPEYRTA